MNVKRYLIATLVLFVFIFLYEWFVHGYLLLGAYQATSDIWREAAEMTTNLPLALAFQLVFAAWIAFVFTQIYRDGGIERGLQFGLYFGVFAGILSASWYIYLPVTAQLGVSWLVSSIIEGLIGGLILGAIYRR
jgi:hypothetical protein